MNIKTDTRHTIKKALFLLTTSLLPFTAISQATLAQEINFQIEPMLLEIQAKQKTQLIHQYKVSGSKNATYYIKAKSFKPQGETGNLEVTNRDLEYLQWITYSPSKLIFKETEEIKTFEMKVDIPSQIEMKDYYFVTVIESETTNKQDLTGNLLSGAIQAPVLLSIEDYKNPSERKGEIVEFATPFLWFETPVDFVLRAKNTGNLRFKSNGYVEIENLILPNSKETITLLPQNILANSTRQITNKTEKPTNMENPIIRWNTSSLLGIFKAETTIEYPSEISPNQLILKSNPIFFIIINRFLIIILTMILMLISIFLYKREKTRKSNSDKLKNLSI